MTNISGIIPKNVIQISHPELVISLYWPNISEEVSQLIDLDTYKNIEINGIVYKYPGMSLNIFKKITRAELDISPY